jgi:hypothetical protein
MPEENGGNDHDLLIELRTEMRGLRQDLKTLSDGVSTRVTNLENTKLDKVDAKEEFKRMSDLAEAKAREIFNTKTDEDKDHETRLRLVETNVTRIMTWGSVSLIILGIAQFLVGKFL